MSGVNMGRKHGVRAKVPVQGLDKVELGFWLHNLSFSAVVVAGGGNRGVCGSIATNRDAGMQRVRKSKLQDWCLCNGRQEWKSLATRRRKLI